jgi:hypothetical protein
MPKHITFIVGENREGFVSFLVEAQKGIPVGFSFPEVNLGQKGLPPVNGIVPGYYAFTSKNAANAQSFLSFYRQKGGDNVSKIKIDSLDIYTAIGANPGPCSNFSGYMAKKGFSPDQMDHLVVLAKKPDVVDSIVKLGNQTDATMTMLDVWRAEDASSGQYKIEHLETLADQLRKAKGVDAIAEASQKYILFQHAVSVMPKKEESEGMIIYELENWDDINTPAKGIKPVAVFFTPKDAMICAEKIQIERAHPPLHDEREQDHERRPGGVATGEAGVAFSSGTARAGDLRPPR